MRANRAAASPPAKEREGEREEGADRGREGGRERVYVK